MVDQVIGVTIKGIGDFSDVVSNVGSVQKALTKLKLPDKLGDNLNKNISNFMKEYDKYQKKIAEGIHTQGDQNAVNKSLNSMLNSYEKIVNEFGKLSKQDFKDIFNLDDGAFASVQKRIKDIQIELKKIKIDPKQLLGPMNELTKLTKAKAVSGSGKGVDKVRAGIEANDFTIMKQGILELETYYERFSSKMSETKRLAMAEEIRKLKAPIEDAIGASDKLEKEARELDKQFNDIGSGASRELGDVATALDKTKIGAEDVVAELKKIHSDEFSFNREAQNIDRQIQSYFGLSQMIRKVGDIARNAFATVKELDAAMTQTAVVTNFSVGDMWDMLPTYTQQANQLGSTIKDVYEAATLYYQQGLNTNQAMGLANETLKMARIAGLDAAEATNMMTAALRGFNMEINQVSAQKINDIYSELAAITASDTKEIGSAMERTASIANAANMDFATTSAFLAQMIETTREAPENLGTAMKTIVARFQEMKQDPTKLVDSEGVAMDVNKVDKALKTIGVSLTNTKGEFRDLDDVFLDISAKWDSLSQGQQRYIATIAAGSRQQSRFIAMMSDYERTMELVDAANNSAGASQRQFEKTLDSMEAKLNMLKNAWDQFTMGLMNNQILKFGVDALTEGFTIVNKFIDLLGNLPAKPFEGITKSALTLATTLGMLQLGKKGSRGLVMGAASWWQKGKIGADGNPMNGGFFKGFAQGWGSSKDKAGIAKALASVNTDSIAYKKGQTFALKFKTGFKAGNIDQEIEKELSNLHIVPKKSLEEGYAKLIEQQATSPERKKELQDGIAQIFSDVKGGKLSTDKIEFAAQSRLGLDTSQLDPALKKVDALSVGFGSLGVSIANAGSFLTEFGAGLGGPVGGALMTVGSLLSTVGSSLALFATESVFATAATEALGTASWFSLAGIKALGAGVQALWAKFLTSPLAPIIAAMAAIAGIAYGIYRIATADKRALESVTDAAAAASEAYDSAKQETSELNDAIEQVKSNEEAFDGLVAGTAAFNEQLVTANDQIMDLIKKYPMLNDYLTTDKNGVMHISEEGLQAVKDYQRQRLANASALNILQNADLNAEENKQKAKDLRKIRGAMTQEEHAQNLEEAELLEQRIKAENESAKIAAVNTALVDKEIGDREKVSAILADQYDMRKSMVQLEGDKHDLRQQYADFYGYNYNRSTKKMTDIEGNEIEFDDKVIKDALKDITVLADLEVDAGSVDTAISSVDRKFSKYFKDSNFFSDILSSNIETNEDELRNLLQNPGQLQDVVSELSSNELAAILGVSADAIELDSGKYEKDLISKLTEKAENIAESQSEAWGEFGAMLAQAEGAKADALLSGQGVGLSNIKSQLEHYSSEQRDLMLSIGRSLESGAGAESMKTFIRSASDIYRENTEETVNELNSLIEDVNWDSPIARLKAYKDLASSTTPEIKKIGEELLDSADSANLLGEAFEEFYNSSDWAEIAEKMDSFVDSSGKINSIGIEKMAEQCHSLNNLLDTGAISAGGVAAAINALGSDGELTLLDLNSTVLQLLSSFGQLDDIIGSAHSSIENFDWGLDTGESADFVKEAAEKWNELYQGGELGNPQLEAYAKYILGEEQYIDLLASNSGDLEATMDHVSQFVNEYADGFDKAWSKLADGQWKDKVPKELQDLGISFGYDNEGNWEWNPGTATTEQLSEWLQAVKGIGPEMAAAMIEDWQNYSPDFRAERQKNDFYAGLDDYISSRVGDQGVTITTQELETIAAATGQEVDEVRAAITETAEQNNQKLTEINNTVEGGLTTSQLNAQYTQAKTGGITGSWIDQLITTVNGKQQVDANQAITQAISDGFTQTQAENMAYDELSKAVAEGTDVWYKDKLLTPEDLASFDSFKNAIAEFEENNQWVEVGKAIAEGVVSYLEGKENPNNNDTTEDNIANKTADKVNNSILKAEEKTTQTTSDKSILDMTIAETAVAAFNKISDSAQKQAEVAEAYKNIQGQTAEELQQSNKDWWTNFWNGSDIENSEANTALTETASNLNESSTGLTSAAQDLSSSAKELSSAADNLNASDKQPGGTFTSGKVQTDQSAENVQGGISIDTTEAIDKVTELQTKLAELNNLIGQGNTYNLTVSGVRDIQKAATAAKELTKNSGTKTIGVKTGKADTSSVDNAKKTIGNTQAKIQVGANVDQATATVRRLQRTINGMSAKLDVSINQTGNRTVNIVVKKSGSVVGTVSENVAAKGRNNHGIVAAPVFGSAARGRYGQVGPKGKGGLTLTGELGYEVAWLPDENRSLVLGTNGPQLINLPGNAVIWDHEQSKRIVKQKAIPAGSHSRSTRPSSTITAATSTSTSKVVQKAADSVTKKAKEAADAVKKVSVWWENIARKTEVSQRIQDNNQKAFEKYLKEMRATLKTTGESLKSRGGGGDDYIKSIGTTMGYYQAQLNKANAELKTLDTGSAAKTQKGKKKQYQAGKDNIAEISYQKGKKTKKKYVNLASYIKEENGTYIIDQTQLNKVKNTNERKAIAEAAEKEINDRLSKKYKAEDEIKKAQEALEELGKELYETFFAWEVELTKIWNITQQIEQTEARISRAKGYSDLLEAQLSSGLISYTNAFGNQIIEAFKSGIEQQRLEIEQTVQSLEQQKTDLSRLLSLDDEIETLKNVQNKLYANAKGTSKLNETERLSYLEYAKQLEKSINAQVKAWEFMIVEQRADNTVDVDFDTKAFLTAKDAGEINDTLAKEIQDYVKQIQENSKELNNTYTNITSKIAETYTNLGDLKDQWASYADELWDISEAETKAQIDNAKKLNDSLTNALKDLLDDVKRKLDQRRQQEDNAKTERDINQKQQRLAALRADTSGGHQVEIVQLEKEIAEAQQSYGRTLEDQTLEKLQQQADEASKQRERQIELQEQIAEEINNAALVNTWMTSPEQFRNEIFEAYKTANEYDKKPQALQEQIERNFESLYAHLTTNKKEQELIEAAIESLTTQQTDLKNFIDDYFNQDKSADIQAANAINALGEDGSILAEIRDSVIEGKNLNITINGEDITAPSGVVEGGTATEVTKLENQKVATASNGSASITPTTPTASATKTYPYGKASETTGTIQKGDNNKKVYAIQWALKELGYYKHKVGTKFGTHTEAAVKKFQKANKINVDGKVGNQTRKKFKAKGYKTGGLATSTGPAWLDGTPSKPELVLNAKDTQNFVALKDVLSHVMNGVGDTSNTYGDILYEININVDKIEKDYDVDRVVDKVKKEIIKGAGYRNVTQVRNLR